MQACYDLLFGLSCPSGRLAETFPKSLVDTPSYNYFANDRFVDEHRESIFVGYRYYNTYGVKPQFPFGYGLSYTAFKYDGLKVSKTSSGYDVAVTVTNAGNVDGCEVVQVYVDNCDCGLMRAKRELRAFDKVFVPSGQSVDVTLKLDDRAFSVYYENKWQAVSGDYVVSVCSDVETPILSVNITVDGVKINGRDREKYPSYFENVVGSFTVAEKDFYLLAGQQKQDYSVPKRGEYTLLNTFEDMQDAPIIKTVARFIRRKAKKQAPSHTLTDPVAQMLLHGAMETPLISLMSVGGVPSKYVMFLLHNANKRHGKAFKALCGRV